MKITPREGDYFQTDGITDEQYRAAVKVFISAGCPKGECNISRHTYLYAGWQVPYSHSVGFLRSDIASTYPGRKLSLSDLLGDEEAPPVGKGLPQIGASVLAKNLGNEFSRFNELTVSIVAHFDDCDGGGVVIFHPSRGHASLSNHHLFLFPIKSERELAIEEMEKEIKDRGDVLMINIASYLYDKGYRKIKDAEK